MSLDVIPRAHSVERVEITPRDVPEECNDFLSHLKDALEMVESEGTVTREASNLKMKVAHDLFERYGYGSVGDSNSLWGKQERLTSFNSDNDSRPQELREVSHALGFIPQDTKDGDRDLNVFVPSLDRYFPITHPVNRNGVDINIVRHSNYKGEPTFLEVAGVDSSLEKLSNYIIPDNDRRSVGVIRYSPDALKMLETACKDIGIHYSIYSSDIGGIPEFEWAPDLSTDEYIVLKPDSGRGLNYKAHSLNSERLACGTKFDKTDDIPTIHPMTLQSISNEVVDLCGHQGCQNQFDKIIPNR